MVVSTKEWKEIGLVLGTVVVFIFIGLVVTNLSEAKFSTLSGAAIDTDVPTDVGMLLLLKEYCSPATGNGNCNAVCGVKTCLPVENNCDVSINNNQCLCCSTPE